MRRNKLLSTFSLFPPTAEPILWHVSRILSFTERPGSHKPFAMKAVNSQLSKDEIVVVTKQMNYYRSPNYYFKTRCPLHLNVSSGILDAPFLVFFALSQV